MNKTDGNPGEWMELEKEYHEKVTMKNELILGSQFLNHFYTADNSEVVLVTAYGSWEAINDAGARTEELVEAAWPDEAARDAFFKKKDSYYVNIHSDEIYATLPNTKPFVADSTNSDKSMIIYIQKEHLAFPEDGSNEEIAALAKEFAEAVEHKNSNIKGYYTYRHRWGSDNREVIRARVFESLEDLAASNAKTQELIEAHWPDEAARDAFFEKYDKYFTGWHGDFIYRNVPELVK
jgi:hypothetical protein